MEIKELTVTYEATINTGNFTNIKPSLSARVELHDGDNPDDVAREVYGKLESMTVQALIPRIRQEWSAVIERTHGRFDPAVERRACPVWQWVYTVDAWGAKQLIPTPLPEPEKQPGLVPAELSRDEMLFPDRKFHGHIGYREDQDDD